MTTSLADTVALADGNQMPLLGLGTWRAQEGGEVEQAVRIALELGYRLIDTASIYGNEAGVGRALADCGIPREQLFITTKVWNSDQGYDSTLKAARDSLDRLGLEYVDLYLIHWPVRGKFTDTWRALERLQQDGLARSIGVSNFLRHHLEELLASATRLPVVNQIEHHPHLQQPDLIEFCKQQRIQVECWSPLMKGEVFSLEPLKAIGQQHGKTAGQVTLRWQLQKGLVTIPKSTKRANIESNAQVFDFELTDEQMAAIDALDQGRRVGPDPDNFDF